MGRKQCCETPEKTTVIFACAGASNVGQITNEAAKKLDQKGVGTFYCLIGLPAGIDGIMANTRGADRVICLDGCGVACARKVLDQAEVPISTYVVATDLGIEKGHHFEVSCDQVDAICSKVLASLA